MATYAFYSFVLQSLSRSSFDIVPSLSVTAPDINHIWEQLGDGKDFFRRQNRFGLRTTVRKAVSRRDIHLFELNSQIEASGSGNCFLRRRPDFPAPLHVIIDSRSGVCQIAIEKNCTTALWTDRMVKYIRWAINRYLEDFGYYMLIKEKRHGRRFKDIMQRKVLDGEAVRQIRLDFANPYMAGAGSDRKFIYQLGYLTQLTNCSNAIYSHLRPICSPGMPTAIDGDCLEDLEQIFALCTQNAYNMSVSFYNSAAIEMRSLQSPLFSIDDCQLEEFFSDVKENGGEGADYALIGRLDEIRREIDGYSHEKTLDDGD